MFYSVFAGYSTGIKFLCEMFDALCCRISSTEQDVKNSRHNLFVVFVLFSLAFFFFNSHPRKKQIPIVMKEINSLIVSLILNKIYFGHLQHLIKTITILITIVKCRLENCFFKSSEQPLNGSSVCNSENVYTLSARFLLYRLEAFTMNNGRTRFIIFLLGNPHLLEG